MTATNNPVQSGYAALARGRLVLLFCFVYFLSQIIIMVITHKLGPDMLNIQLTFSADEFARILKGWSHMGLAIYKRHFYLDFIHPVFYALFLSSAIAYCTHTHKKKAKPFILVLFFLPYVAGFCDLMENTLHELMINQCLPITGTWVALSATATWTKWTLAAVSLVAILIFGTKKAIHRTKG